MIVWAPSLTACSGSSWTSMISASAPAAIAALDIGNDQARLAGAVRRVDDDRQVALVVQIGNRRQRQREPGVVLVGADAALAEHHVGVAPVEDVLGGEQELVEGGAHSALQERGLARIADGLEQLVVLHVAGTDLEHVGVLGRRWATCSGAMTSVTIARPVSSPAVASILSPSSLWPWKL